VPALPAYQAYLFDLDGTVYLGEEVIAGAPEAIARLRARGAGVMYITNKPLYPPDEYAAKLTRLGLPTAPAEVITSANVLGDVIATEYAGQRVLVIGEQPVCDEVVRGGGQLVDDWRAAEVLVASWDRELTYAKLDAALQALLHGAVYLATNPDAMCPVGAGEFVPDCGALLAALGAMTGREPDVMAGKPGPRLPLAALARLGVAPAQAALVGDRLSTDITCGNRAGLATIAVLTGEATRESIAAAEGDARPDYILDSVADLH
jgi:arabinose operon protein AraL